jgi:hypothetical protein
VQVYTVTCTLLNQRRHVAAVPSPNPNPSRHIAPPALRSAPPPPRVAAKSRSSVTRALSGPKSCPGLKHTLQAEAHVRVQAKQQPVLLSASPRPSRPASSCPPPPAIRPPRELRLRLAGHPRPPAITKLSHSHAPAVRLLTVTAPAPTTSPPPPCSGVPDGLHARHPQALRAGPARRPRPGHRAGDREGCAAVQIQVLVGQGVGRGGGGRWHRRALRRLQAHNRIPFPRPGTTWQSELF